MNDTSYKRDRTNEVALNALFICLSVIAFIGGLMGLYTWLSAWNGPLY